MGEHSDYDHEEVHGYYGKSSGLRAIIAVHSTMRGPAIGGCRMAPYASFDDALTDVLRLSHGMTLKCAIGEIPFGGGKAVIIGAPDRDKSDQLLGAFAKCVDGLGGRYITSFDAGTTLDDLRVMAGVTPHVGGLDPEAGNASASTAHTVFECLRRAFEMTFGDRAMASRHVAIQGAGNVGLRLAEKVLGAGGRVTVCDVSDVRVEKAARLGCSVVAPRDIFTVEADALAPCALGGALTAQTVAGLTAPIVCGGANNQLASPDVGERILSRNILYCPDFLANSGGIIDLHYQLNRVDRVELPDHLDRITDKIFNITDESRRRWVSPQIIAERQALASAAA